LIRRPKIGIPYRTRENPENFLNYTTSVTFNDKPVSYKRQNEVFIKFMENPFKDEYYTFLLSCESNNVIPQLAAKTITSRFVAEKKSVFWYNVSKNHKREDERLKDFLAEMVSLDALVIDGAYTKTNINNIDKIRELSAMFDNIPIFVIIAGGFGPDFYRTQVFNPFNLFIHFGDAPRKKIVSV